MDEVSKEMLCGGQQRLEHRDLGLLINGGIESGQKARGWHERATSTEWASVYIGWKLARKNSLPDVVPPSETNEKSVRRKSNLQSCSSDSLQSDL